MNMQDLFRKKLVQYDSTFEYDMRMYDHLPYKRDAERCNYETSKNSASNVYKASSVKVNTTPYIYTAPVFVYQAPVSAVAASVITDDITGSEDNKGTITGASSDGVSMEQLDSLLTDNNESPLLASY